MTDDKRAELVKRLITLVVLGGAVALGFFVELPTDWLKKKEEKKAEVEEVTKENYKQVVSGENRLTILNAMVDGNPDSEKLKEILEKLKEDKYGEQVENRELNVAKEPELAEGHGIKQEDLEEFAGQLEFYADGKRLGQLKGETDPTKVEKTIDRYLAGLVQRYGPGWLPKVEGMSQGGAEDPIIQVKPADQATE